MNKTAKLDFSMTPELKAELQVAATKEDVPLAHLVRKAIREYLERVKRDAQG